MAAVAISRTGPDADRLRCAVAALGVGRGHRAARAAPEGYAWLLAYDAKRPTTRR